MDATRSWMQLVQTRLELRLIRLPRVKANWLDHWPCRNQHRYAKLLTKIIRICDSRSDTRSVFVKCLKTAERRKLRMSIVTAQGRARSCVPRHADMHTEAMRNMTLQRFFSFLFFVSLLSFSYFFSFCTLGYLG